ncbi:response regulator transcription factor [Psychrosphaera sp. F3M07]|uniref:response regulator transcription factor n=1 Tax=Psychrosphaera sp. F3M07 TaxID=2841560 RepID=UPI001C088672|nr:response regulator transcription factor [Psychrosphaera sp. F3M07]MBU2918705.1 response regulator transcription factor [Psychrosphaera sp. F3M07]
MNNQKVNILLVEDDKSLSDWICDYLSNKGFNVTQCYRGDDAVDLILNTKPDVVILDGMLPGLDGFEVCKTVRQEYNGSILMLTARDEEIDEVLGLELGADEYILKPVRARALYTRINRCLSRKDETTNNEDIPANANHLTFNSLSIDPTSQKVLLNNQEIKLTSKEFEVMWIIANNAGNIISRDWLISQVRGLEYDGLDRTIDIHISKLRKKLGDESKDPKKIKTIWGKGYLFVPDAW